MVQLKPQHCEDLDQGVKYSYSFSKRMKYYDYMVELNISDDL